MLNPLSNSEERAAANEEIKLLLKAMNIVPNKYNPKKLRYGRIGICSDADADGSEREPMKDFSFNQTGHVYVANEEA